MDQTNDKYPMLTKLKAVSGESQNIGAFLEWMAGQGVRLMYWVEASDNGEPAFVWRESGAAATLDEYVDDEEGAVIHNPNHVYTDEGWVPERRNIEELLAAYFEIDLRQVECERQQVLHDFLGE